MLLFSCIILYVWNLLTSYSRSQFWKEDFSNQNVLLKKEAQYNGLQWNLLMWRYSILESIFNLGHKSANFYQMLQKSGVYIGQVLVLTENYSLCPAALAELP